MTTPLASASEGKLVPQAISRAVSSPVSTLLLMAALRAWPSLAASASIPLTIAEALALEARCRLVIQKLRLGRIPEALARSLALRERAGFFFFLAGLDGETRANYRRKARLGAVRFLDPTTALAMGLCLRVAESRGGRGLLAWLALADKIARLLGYAGFHGVAAGGKGWQPMKLSRLAGERGLSLEDVLAGRLASPGNGGGDGPQAPVEAASLEELQPLIGKVRAMQKAYRAGMAFAAASGMAPAPEATVQAKEPRTEALPAGDDPTPNARGNAAASEAGPVAADEAEVQAENPRIGDDAKPDAGGSAQPAGAGSAGTEGTAVQAGTPLNPAGARSEHGESASPADAVPAPADEAATPAGGRQAEDGAMPEPGGCAGSAGTEGTSVLAETPRTAAGGRPEAGGEAVQPDAGPDSTEEAAVQAKETLAEDDAKPGADDGPAPDEDGPASTDEYAVQANDDAPGKKCTKEEHEALEDADARQARSCCQQAAGTGGGAAPRKHSRKHGRKHGGKHGRKHRVR